MTSKRRGGRRRLATAAVEETEAAGENDDDVDDELQETSSVRRLAVQLGLSRTLQRIDESLQDAATSSRAGVGDEQTREKQSDPDGAEGAEDDDDDEDDDDVHLDAPLTPLRSDLSASESLSSDLSLPRSFGNYDPAHRPRFDDQLTSRTPRRSAGGGPRLPSASALPASSAASLSTSNSHEMMRRFYEAQVEKIRAQLGVVTRAHQQLQTAAQEERRQWQTKLETIERRHTGEREDLQRANATLQAEVTQLRKRLEIEKMHHADLQISESLAEQLERQSEDELSVKEFVQLHVHRKIRAVEAELVTLRRELEAARAQCATYKSHASSASDEASHVAHEARAKELRLQHDLELAEATRSELEREVGNLCAQLNALKAALDKQAAGLEGGRPREDIITELQRVQSELEHVREQHAALSERHESAVSRKDELEQQALLLLADKAFLQDAKRQLEDQETRLVSQLKALQTKYDSMAAAHVTESSELSRVQEETRLHFEKQLQVEVSKFMEMSKREIDTIRRDAQSIYERENRLLKESRDDAMNQIDLLQNRLQSVQASLDEKVLEMTRQESVHTTTLASLRNDLKMKHFEMSQLGVSLEERSVEIRNARLEIEMLERKVAVHKEEFSRLESTTSTRITQLEAALEVERNKLKEYEQLEVDLDDAVLQTGAMADENVQNSNGGSNNVHEVLGTFGAIPTTTKRRFQQSVLLAQRVVKYQREAAELRRKLDVASCDQRRVEADNADLRQRLAGLQQPQSYLIEKLVRKDSEIARCREALERLQDQLRELRAEYHAVNNARMALQGQLQQVLTRRGELDLLKSTALALRKQLAQPTQQQQQQQLATASPTTGSLKSPPSPATLSRMTRPPTPQPVASSESEHGTEPSPPTPKWYIKLRS